MVFSNTTLAHGDNLHRMLTNFQDQELSHSMFLTWQCKYVSSRGKKKSLKHMLPTVRLAHHQMCKRHRRLSSSKKRRCLLEGVHLVIQYIVSPIVLYRCESGTIKEAECWRIDAFKLWCCGRLLRVPWTARRSNQPILKEINPEYSLEGLMLTLKLQYFSHLCKELTHWKRPWCWERLRAGGEGGDREWDGITNSIDMSLSKPWETVSEGQGSLECSSPWGHKELDTTEQLNDNKI